MLILIGFITVIASILIGFMMAGGQVLILLQWAEFVIIVGAAFGSILVAAPSALLKKIVIALRDSFRSAAHSRHSYLILLGTSYDLFVIGQREGLRRVEDHVEDPLHSDILSKNREFVRDEFNRNFFCDAIKILLSGGIAPHELEAVIDADIETFEAAESRPIIATLAKMADSFPGLGIVAAVLGIIVTMSSIDEGAEFVGRHVAAALVGTFLGVLLCYGFVSPMATHVEQVFDNRVRYLEAMKTCIVAYAKGHSPVIAVEMARRAIPSEYRPSFVELEKVIHRKEK